MTDPSDYDIRLAARALRRYWWVVLTIPAVALAIQLAQIRTAPYRAEFRAVVVLPGDTEVPGSSERPELMIMDDVPALVDSAFFAERVKAQLEANGVSMESEEIESALTATRYARTVTVVARDDNRSRAEGIASAAEAVLSSGINEALVAGSGPLATVTIIDPVEGARRGEPDQWQIAGIVTVGILFAGVVAALVLDGLRRSETKRVEPH